MSSGSRPGSCHVTPLGASNPCRPGPESVTNSLRGSNRDLPAAFPLPATGRVLGSQMVSAADTCSWVAVAMSH